MYLLEYESNIFPEYELELAQNKPASTENRSKLHGQRSDLAPSNLSHGFVAVSDSHRYQTRGSSFNYRLSKEWSLAPNSFHCTSIRLWNLLLNELKEVEVFRVFKQKLKTYLLSKYK